MDVKDIISIIAIVISPIAAVIIGQYLQDKAKIRADKMNIFNTLMIYRGLGWSVEVVKALNVIEVVFFDDKAVLQQWKVYYDKLTVGNAADAELFKIKAEGDKLLEVMAKSLGYKRITWETIQKPYTPKGLVDSMNMQQQYQGLQLSVMDQMKTFVEHTNMNGNGTLGSAVKQN